MQIIGLSASLRWLTAGPVPEPAGGSPETAPRAVQRAGYGNHGNDHQLFHRNAGQYRYGHYLHRLAEQKAASPAAAKKKYPFYSKMLQGNCRNCGAV